MTDQADMEAREILAAEFGHGNVGTSLAVGGMKNHAKIISAMLAFETKRGAEREAAAYARAAEVAELVGRNKHGCTTRQAICTEVRDAIEALGEAKG